MQDHREPPEHPDFGTVLNGVPFAGELELGMADIETLTRNIERVAKKARSGDKDSIAQKEVFERAKVVLEEDKPLRAVEWTKEERAALKPLFLITIKPVMYVANVADDDLAGDGELAQVVAKFAAAPVFLIAALASYFLRPDSRRLPDAT